MDEVLQIIAEYGLESGIIALVINLLTGLVKLPLKKLASRMEDSTKATRFIVFLPIIFGFGLTALYVQFLGGGFVFDKAFVALWVASSSLSLTIYAIFEKMFPKKKQVLTNEEISANQALLDVIQETAATVADKNLSEQAEEQKSASENTEGMGLQASTHQKIILRGKKDE